jgi:hypothetical protein
VIRVIVEVRPDREQGKFVVNVGDKQIKCSSIWIDEELYSFDEDANEFDVIFLEARYVKLSMDICLVETRLMEVVPYTESEE